MFSTFSRAEKGGGSRPVLIYVSGGAGNKLQGGPNGDVFYDNVMLWAVEERHGRGEHAAPPRPGLGRPRKRRQSSSAVGESEHRSAQRKSWASFHLDPVRRQHPGQHLHRPSRILRPQRSRRQRRDLHVGSRLQYSSSHSTARSRVDLPHAGNPMARPLQPDEDPVVATEKPEPAAARRSPGSA